MAIAIALIVLLVGSVLFHFLSPWYLTELASNWGALDGTISITFWVTGFVFAAVNLFMAYAIIRYRYQAHRRARYEPENKKLEAWLTGLTTLGIAALLAPGLAVWGQYVTVPDDADVFEVAAQQWHWTFRYPGADGELGAVKARLISEQNPFGMDPDDPSGQDDVLVNNPHTLLPVDRPVKAVLRSKDVIHNFQVAQFRAKMDMVPGQVSYLWLTPIRTGKFEILCAELCGIGHFAMRGLIEVVEQEKFNAWLDEQPTFRETVDRGLGDPAAGEQRYAVCVSCHGADGGGNKDLNAPRLAGLESWYVLRQLEHFKSGVRGDATGDTYGKQMQAFAKTLPDRAAMADVAAYIETLPDEPAPDTIIGDAEAGEEMFRTCAACHGAGGQGRFAQNAPRLAGMSDWYLLRQLDNFRHKIRGSHPADIYGTQMAEMAKAIHNYGAVKDVVAYINTLPPRPPQKVADGQPAQEE